MEGRRRMSSEVGLSANASYFEGAAGTGSYLAARGFDKRGDKSGGIVGPRVVTVPAGAVLFRLFHVEGRAFGDWWSTAHELAAVFRHFGRAGPSAAAGRAAGKGILHAVLAVRHDWSGGSPDHLGRFVCASPTTELAAYYGVGDDAPSEDKRTVQKAVRILGSGGGQIGVRQLFFPCCRDYQDRFAVEETGWTDGGLLAAIRRHGAGPLPFE